MELLRLADCPAVPWKNGGGTTRQLLAWPPAATLDDFVLRVSVAEVDSDGPFSCFAGIDRTLGLLDGTGLALTRDGAAWATLTPASLLVFDGGDAIASQRLDGAVRDVNVMTRRGRAHHHAAWLPLNGEMALPLPAYSLLLADGALHAGDIALARHDALWLPQAATLTLRAAAPTRLLRVGFELAAP